MSKVTVVQVIYNSKKFIEPVFSAIFAQTFKDFNVVAVISGNDDGSKEFLMQKFPQVEIIDPGYNIGFAAGHNLVFSKFDSEFFQLVNPDMIMEPNYIEEVLKVFQDSKVGAATGKLYNIPLNVFDLTPEQFNKQKSSFKFLDTTGIVINRSGRARDRGQHEVDIGQYDRATQTQGVCGAGCMYRAAALYDIAYKSFSSQEFFDKDFHSYYEDVDLSWRMSNKGLKNVFVPAAVGYHARGTASTIGGYKKVFAFIKYRRKINPWIRKQGYKNHILMYVKNSPYFYLQFFIREFFLLIYSLIFEISTLSILPEMFKLIPKMWQKRKTTFND